MNEEFDRRNDRREEEMEKNSADLFDYTSKFLKRYAEKMLPGEQQVEK